LEIEVFQETRNHLRDEEEWGTSEGEESPKGLKVKMVMIQGGIVRRVVMRRGRGESWSLDQQ